MTNKFYFLPRLSDIDMLDFSPHCMKIGSGAKITFLKGLSHQITIAWMCINQSPCLGHVTPDIK
jgi:hypothetical protein